MMKHLIRNSFFVASLLVLGLASCKKDTPSSGGTIDGMGFTATTEQNGGNSKTYLDGLVDGKRKVLWSENDQIKVANYGGVAASGSTTLTYELTDGVDKPDGVFYTGQNHDDFFHPNYVAAYPAAGVTGISGKEVTFSLPGNQVCAEAGTFGNGCNPMVAYSSDQTLQFKNVCGALCIPLTGTNHVSRVVLTSNKTTDHLWGTFTVNADNPDSFAYSSGGDYSITLNCDVTLSATATELYFMLPPGMLSTGFKLDLYDGGVRLYSNSTSNSATVERCKVRKTTSISVAATTIPVGAIPAAFTVGMDGSTPIKVYFSQGNLQYIGSAGDGSLDTHNKGAYFKFADNQWDILGESNKYASLQTDRDLFGWGTSGWNNGNYLYDPYRIYNSGSAEYYTSDNGYGYGPTDGSSYNYHLTGDYAHADWGVHNAISNGGNVAGQWRTLTKDEWVYVVNGRTTDARYAKAKVNNVSGMILFPDVYTHPSSVELPVNINVFNSAPGENDYSIAEWNLMESAGAVFLPLAGYRNLQAISYSGLYWSSTNNGTASAWRLCFYGNVIDPSTPINIMGSCNRFFGCAVRLVCPAP